MISGQIGAGEGRLDDLDTDPLVRVHHLPFFVGQFAWFQQDRIRHSDLANIMQQCGDLQNVRFADWHQTTGGGDAQVSHLPRMVGSRGSR